MRFSLSFALLIGALLTALFSLMTDQSHRKLTSLRNSLEQQQRMNDRLSGNVTALKREAQGLKNNPRAIEKAARSELGMARDNEIIVFFDEGKRE